MEPPIDRFHREASHSRQERLRSSLRAFKLLQFAQVVSFFFSRMSKSFISAALVAAYPADEPEGVEMGCRVADPALFADMLDRLDRPLAELAPDSSEARTVSGLIKHSTAVARRGLAGQAAPVSPFTEDRRSTPGYLTFVCSFYPAAFPKPPPRGLPTARQTHAHFHLLLARFFSLYGG